MLGLLLTLGHRRKADGHDLLLDNVTYWVYVFGELGCVMKKLGRPSH